MIRLLLGAAPARIRAAPALFALQVAAIALGTGAVLSVQLLNRAALDTLDASLEVLSGDAELVVSGLFERRGSLPDEVWPAVLGASGVERAAPVVRLPEVTIVAGEFTERIPVWGVDILSGSFDFAAPGDDEGVFALDLFFLGGIVLPRDAASALGVAVGDTVRLESGDTGREAPVAGVYPTPDGPASAFLDIAFAQALRGGPGLDRIEVAVRDGRDTDAVAQEITASVPGVLVEPGGTLREQGRDLFSAFRLNLLALSAVSLLVGAFLVYASVRAALAARRRELGLYRALGAPAKQVGSLLLGEVLATALVGAALGIPVGALAAFVSLDRISITISSFYLLERIEAVTLTPEVVAISAAVGPGAALVGALPEIAAESRRPPVALLAPGRDLASAVPRRTRQVLPAVIGTALMALAAWAVVVPDSLPARFGGGFAAAGALLLGAALLPGAALRLLSSVSRKVFPRSAAGRGMVAAIREPLSTGPPVAALVVAVTMLIGVTALIGSFRATLDGWLAETLAADIYVSRARGPGRVALVRRPLPPEVLATTAADPAVRAQDLLRAVRVRIAGRPVSVQGVEASLPAAGERFSFVGAQPGGRAGVLGAFRSGDILVSEPLARRFELGVGDTLPLPGTTGGADHPARVAGIYREYGNELGALFMDRGLLNDLYPSPDPEAPEVHGAALYLHADADATETMTRLEAKLAGAAWLTANRTLRDRALGVFDQTMAVTALLRGFALLIAALGMGLALWTLVRERAPEIALLRALGAPRAQVVAGFLGRGGLIVALALTIGGGAGALLTLLLVTVVNPAWFGWTLDLHWSPEALAAQTAAVILAGLLAAAIPARSASRVTPNALREEL